MKMSVFPILVNMIVNVTWMGLLTSVNVQGPGKEQPAAVSVAMETDSLHSFFTRSSKHLMTAPKGNSEFCLETKLTVSCGASQ